MKMLPDKKHLIEQFEEEVWLYLDKDLPAERMQYWNDNIFENEELKKLLDENIKLTNAYSKIPLNKLSHSRYSEIISSAVKKPTRLKNFILSINPFSIEKDKLFSPVKIAFGGITAAAAIVILLLSNKPNPVKNLSKDILQWNSEDISQQISEVSISISVMRDKNFKEFFEKNRNKEKLDKDIHSIGNGIQKLRNEIKDQSL
jgi:hypothetical protein